MTDLELSSIFIKHNVKVFLTLVRTRNFTQAAKDLDLSQSSVSRIMNELENQLGVSLIDNSTRPIRLTPEAMHLADYWTKTVNDMDAFIQSLRESNSIKRPLRLGVGESVGRILSTSIIQKFRHDFSSITVLTSNAPDLLHLLDSDKIDFFLCSNPFFNRNDLYRRTLFREPESIIVPKSLKISESPTWNDLLYCGLPIIHYHSGHSGGPLMQRHFAQLGINFVNRIEIDDSELLLSYVGDGLGWGLTPPTTLLKHRILSTAIKALQPPNPVPTRDIYLICRKGEHEHLAKKLSAVATEVFSEVVVPQLLEKMPWSKDFLFVDLNGELHGVR